jgi:CheY-like chemotaxis protein
LKKDCVILIVEDDEISYMLFEEFFKKTKIKLIWTKYGQKAIQICESNNDIDLVLMDIKLPDIDGFESTRQIKKFRQGLPIIAQTACALAGDREKSFEAGCDDYIPKPINPKHLFEKINKHIPINN